MKQWTKVLCSVVTVAVAILMTGCGGGSSGPTSPAFYAGTYTGAFAGTTATGDAIGGRFTATADNSGNLVGTVTQGGTTFPATGQINNNGDITVTATGGSGAAAFTSVLTGRLEAHDGTIIGNGTFSTTQGGVANAATGRFTAIRSRTGANQFAGAYTGTFSSTTPAGISGTFNVTADANGALFGLVNQPGVGTYSATGFISPTGDVLVFAVGSGGGNPPRQFVSTLIGTAVRSGSNVTVAGTFETVQGNITEVAGTFTGTRQ